MTVLDYRSGEDERANRSNIAPWLGWAIYLGMSWTWCIGMFLPVLLIRDYGPLSWWIFAVPNVVGAAAMGWVLDVRTSQQITANHRGAIATFSFVTATFQIFFAFWVFQILRAPGGSAWIMVALAAITFIVCRGEFTVRLAALTVLLVSLASVLAADRFGMLDARFEFDPKVLPELLALASICVFGFALCPYLDATFHLARQRTSRQAGRAAFGVGFGVFFFAMIFFTREYASTAIQWLANVPHVRTAFAVIGTYWMVQLAFTTGIHWNAAGWRRALLTLLIGGALAYSTPFIHSPRFARGDLVYRFFISFYGLVFPSYVWLCMIPTWREPTPPSRRSVGVFAAAVLLAAPFYWLGFIQRGLIWVLPGLGIVLLARLAVPQKRFSS